MKTILSFAILACLYVTGMCLLVSNSALVLGTLLIIISFIGALFLICRKRYCCCKSRHYDSTEDQCVCNECGARYLYEN